MKTNLPRLKQTLILTPAIFMLAFWVLALSSSGIVASIGIFKLMLWALLLSFGAAISITLFVRAMLDKKDE